MKLYFATFLCTNSLEFILKKLITFFCMSYRTRAKYKSIKRVIFKIQESLKFKFGHISTGGKIVLFGCSIVIISFLFPWVSSIDGTISGGALARVSGRPAIMMSLTLSIVIFAILSINKKSKVQLVSSIYFKDYMSCIIGGIFIITLGLNSLSFIGGLQMFESNIISGKGPVLALCGGVMMILGGIIMKIYAGKSGKGTYIHEGNNDSETQNQEGKNNMKLPF